MEVRTFSGSVAIAAKEAGIHYFPLFVSLERPVCKTRKSWVFHLATSIGGMWWQGAERGGE